MKNYTISSNGGLPHTILLLAENDAFSQSARFLKLFCYSLSTMHILVGESPHYVHPSPQGRLRLYGQRVTLVGGRQRAVLRPFVLNTHLHAYIIVEVKVTEFEVSFYGQLSGYMSLVNHILKEDITAQPQVCLFAAARTTSLHSIVSKATISR